MKWDECLVVIWTGYRVQVGDLIIDNSVGLWAGIQSADEWVPERPNFEYWSHQRKAICLLSCRNHFPVPEQQNENNKYVYRQSQVRTNSGIGVKWAGCLIIIDTDYFFIFLSILDSPVGL